MVANNENKIAVMDYMKVVNRLQDPYIAAEKAWKPIHQERINQGILTGWYFYKVHFAYEGNDYNYATINTYNKFSKLENPYPRDIIANTHPDKGYDGFEDLTEEARKKVRSEMSYLVNNAIKANQKIPSKYLKVAFIEVEERNKDIYKQNEDILWKSVQNKFNADGVQDWWAVYQLEFPHGTNANYQFITISAVSEFENLEKLDYFGAFKEVHPYIDFEESVAKTLETRSAYRAELWELVDYLEK